MSHALERTSPHGTPFVGYCIKCGQRDLAGMAVNYPCPADDVVSDTNAMLALLKEPDPER